MASCPACGRWNITGRMSNIGSLLDKKDYCFNNGLECYKDGEREKNIVVDEARKKKELRKLWLSIDIDAVRTLEDES